MNRNFLGRTALTFAATAALLVSGVAAASAQTARPQQRSAISEVPLPACGSSTLCTFQNAFYNEDTSGSEWDYDYASNPHDEWFRIRSGSNNEVSSFYANREFVTDFSKSCPAGSNWNSWSGGTAIADLKNGWIWPDGSGMNDSISAIALRSSDSADFPAHGAC